MSQNIITIIIIIIIYQIDDINLILDFANHLNPTNLLIR
jgi:hypothetical protein